MPFIGIDRLYGRMLQLCLRLAAHTVVQHERGAPPLHRIPSSGPRRLFPNGIAVLPDPGVGSGGPRSHGRLAETANGSLA